jgi:glutamine synthetase
LLCQTQIKSLQQIASELITKELASDERVKVAGIDIDGVLRGKVLSKEKFLSALKSGGLAFCSVIFGWDMHDKTYERLTFSTADNGYADILARIDLRTFRRVPWEHNIPLFLVDFFNPSTEKPVELCPRGLLKRVLADGSALNASGGGYHANAGVEFEWFNFLETPKSLADKSYINMEQLTPGMFGYSLLRPTQYQDYFYDIFDQLALFNIPIEGLHTETGRQERKLYGET